MRNSPCYRRLMVTALLSGPVSAFWLTACKGPIGKTSQQEVQQALSHAMSRETADVASKDVVLAEPPSNVTKDFPEDRIIELNRMAGPQADQLEKNLDLGANLMGDSTKMVAVNLRDAVLSAVKNNLQAQIGSITPAIKEADITRAEARFDAVFFSELDWNKLDDPAIISIIKNTPLGTGLSQTDETKWSTGINKKLVTGGALSITATTDRTTQSATGQGQSPTPAYSSTVELSLTQPLLRGFGSEANLSEIRLAENAHRKEIETYRQTLETTVSDTESAYWNLVAAREVLKVRERLLDRGVKTRQKLIDRKGYDVEPAQESDAIARVQNRETDVIRARDNILRSSDKLKQLMNAPGLEVGGEAVVLPLDTAQPQPVTFNYADALDTALQHRPEIRESLLAIDDQSIREMLADNLRLPTLNFQGTVRFNGLADNFGDSYNEVADTNFIDYLLQLRLEYPIGNREALANYRMARLQRIQSVLDYQKTVQSVTRDVKDALRDMALNFRLLSRTRDARIAAAENLRTINVKEELNASSTPEFLNLKLTRQEALAQAEVQEIEAQINYQIALAHLYQAMGVGLTRNGIEFKVPAPGE